MGKQNINEMTYIVIATREHEMDAEYLKHALGTKAAYIGMVSSRSKVPSLYKRLESDRLHPAKDPKGLFAGWS